MPYFTKQNTEGFSQDNLNVLNEAIELANLDDDEQVVENFSNKLLNAWVGDRSKNTPEKLVARCSNKY